MFQPVPELAILRVKLCAGVFDLPGVEVGVDALPVVHNFLVRDPRKVNVFVHAGTEPRANK